MLPAACYRQPAPRGKDCVGGTGGRTGSGPVTRVSSTPFPMPPPLQAPPWPPHLLPAANDGVALPPPNARPVLVLHDGDRPGRGGGQ